MFTSTLDTCVHPLLGPTTAGQRELSQQAADRSALLQAVADRRRRPHPSVTVRRFSLRRRRSAERAQPA